MDAYLVRVWRPSPDAHDPPTGLRGTVVALTSRADLTFDDEASLLAILGRSDQQVIGSGADAKGGGDGP